MSADSAVLVDRRDDVIWITINRPERRNAINRDVIEGIQAGMETASADPEIRAAVLTGTGEKAFCAGGDLQQGTSVFGDQFSEPGTDFGRLARVVRRMGIPIVGRINGACVAGGMALMALCDLVVAAEHARFGLPEARVGVFPMQVQVYFRNLVLPRHAAELIFTGELIDARRAAAIGLVNQVVTAAELDARVEQLLTRLRGNSPTAIRRGKLAIATMEMMNFHEAIAFAENEIMLTAATDDAREGLAAFNEKRKPRWSPDED
jgi:enoyl-CoA hydratase/carnithine racemase